MIRLFGAALVAAGCAWTGFQAAARLRERTRALEETASGLALLEQELELGGLPLPRLMEELSRRAAGPARALFRDCLEGLDRLDQTPFPLVWRQAVERREELGRQGQECLYPLGEVLGRCDSLQQCRALRAVRLRLEELSRRSEEDSRRQGRVFQTLGLSGGAFLVILLL